jgi:hypothetical protein
VNPADISILLVYIEQGRVARLKDDSILAENGGTK